jgi:hypothetical protein
VRSSSVFQVEARERASRRGDDRGGRAARNRLQRLALGSAVVALPLHLEDLIERKAAVPGRSASPPSTKGRELRGRAAAPRALTGRGSPSRASRGTRTRSAQQGVASCRAPRRWTRRTSGVASPFDARQKRMESPANARPDPVSCERFAQADALSREEEGVVEPLVGDVLSCTIMHQQKRPADPSLSCQYRARALGECDGGRLIGNHDNDGAESFARTPENLRLWKVTDRGLPGTVVMACRKRPLRGGATASSSTHTTRSTELSGTRDRLPLRAPRRPLDRYRRSRCILRGAEHHNCASRPRIHGNFCKVHHETAGVEAASRVGQGNLAALKGVCSRRRLRAGAGVRRDRWEPGT